MTQLAQPLPVEITNKRHSLLRSTICISSLIFVCGFYFIVEFVANFFSFTKVKDSFIIDIPSVLLFLGLAGTAFVQFIRGLFRGTKLAGDQICRLLVVIGALAALFYRDDATLLADKLFFWTNETSFKEKVTAEGSNRAVLLSYRSSSNFYKFFIYTGSISLPEERNLSLSEKDSLNPPLLDEVKACPTRAQRLEDTFYVVSVSC